MNSVIARAQVRTSLALLIMGSLFGCGGGVTIYGRLEYSPAFTGTSRAEFVEIREGENRVKIPVVPTTGEWKYKFDKQSVIDTSRTFDIVPPILPSGPKSCSDGSTVPCNFVASSTGLKLEACSRQKKQPMVLEYQVACEGCSEDGPPPPPPPPD